ncbi:MAG: hypothetical protein GY930_19875, partial [bacterium]|nr:hypothetical protein [bacterium]
EGLASKAKALEKRGEVIVREALVAKLASIRFSFMPYSRDARPMRLEHVQSKGGLGGLLNETTSTEGK